MNTTLKTRLTRATVKLLLTMPFFGALATQLDHKEDNTIPTACTDGKSIWWNSAWVGTLDDDELRGVLCHEVMHVAYGHTWRRGDRDAEGWNIAADKAINHIILQAGGKLPKCGIFPTAAEAGKSAEALYQMLPPSSNGGKAGGKGKGDPGGCGGVKDSPGGEEGKKEQEAKWTVLVTQAAMAAKGRGNLPADLEREIEKLINPPTPWESILRDFVQSAAKNDYNWNRPNSRYASAGFVLPTLISNELGDVIVVVDTSGSIDGEMLDRFAGEISAVLGAYDTTVHVVYVDADVHNSEIFTRADMPLKLHPKGGGGTDFRPAFDWVGKQNLEPACLIYFTDGEGSFPSDEPEYPVLWAMTGTVKAPFGRVVRL